jgi:DNA-binding MarR family transcriptional regulator
MGTNTSRAPGTREVLDAVRRIVHALRESSRLAEKYVGLSGAQLFVLQKLAESPGASVNELAERTHTHQSSVSTVVARLVERGLVKRTTSRLDRRRVELTLAARGRALTEGAPDVAQERLIRAIDTLPAGRRRLLAETLGELAAALDVAGRVPAMFFEDRTPRERRRRRA